MHKSSVPDSYIKSYLNVFLMSYMYVCMHVFLKLHFTSNYTLYNYYVTNKETLNLDVCTKSFLKTTSSLCARAYLANKADTDSE